MLFLLLLINALFNFPVNGEDATKEFKQYAVLPFPLELPNRNDRAEQCWLRVEDAELVETVAVYCHLAQAFLINFIRDYNSQKMNKDGVYVSLWFEESRPIENIAVPNNSKNDTVDWKLTTLMDPTTQRRLYVTKDAECKLIMYSREGMTSYDVDCKNVLYYINVHLSAATRINISVIVFIVIFFNSVLFIPNIW